MKIKCIKQNSKMRFLITDYHQKYEPVLKMCYYQQENNSYHKDFDVNIKNIENIASYFTKNAQRMFDQLGYYAPIPWQKALLSFLQIVEGHNIDWWLTGSCACCIRGIPLNPHDVDIMVNSKHINTVRELFKDYLIEPIINTNGWLTKDFGVLFLHARIDIATDPVDLLDKPEPVDCGPYAKENLQEVIWQGYKIKVPLLQLHINANKKRGRTERVNVIKQYLK